MLSFIDILPCLMEIRYLTLSRTKRCIFSSSFTVKFTSLCFPRLQWINKLINWKLLSGRGWIRSPERFARGQYSTENICFQRGKWLLGSAILGDVQTQTSCSQVHRSHSEDCSWRQDDECIQEVYRSSHQVLARDKTGDSLLLLWNFSGTAGSQTYQNQNGNG